MKAFFKTNSLFFFPYLLFIIAGLALIIFDSKAEKHLEFNSYHSSVFDFFFYYITFLGDGITAVLVVVLLLAVNYRAAVFVGVSNIIASLVTQILKHTVFADVVRPKKYFEGIHDLYLVPGVDNYLYNSFPSGHSTCAFALYLALALITENRIIKFICFVIAFLVGCSRIYLSQHFFEDVFAGSIIGVIFTLMVYYTLNKFKTEWMSKSVIKLVKRI